MSSFSYPSIPSTPTMSRRLLCMVYELILLFGVVFIAGYLFDTLTQSRDVWKLRHLRQAWLFFVLGIYFVWFWTHGGQTLAMKTWHIRLVTREGHALRWPRALLRYLCCWIFLLPALGVVAWLQLHPWAALAALIPAVLAPLLWMKFDREHGFLQDRLAGTRLVLEV